MVGLCSVGHKWALWFQSNTQISAVLAEALNTPFVAYSI